MSKHLFLTLIICFVVGCVFGQQIIRGPYLQKASPNRITIKWRTDIPTRSQINYGVAQNNFSFSATDKDLKTEHEIELVSLSPNTTYYYEVTNMVEVLEAASPSLYFKTHPITGTTDHYKFWILGDCGTANQNQRNVRDAYYQYIGNEHTDGILFLGDNAYNSGTDTEYQRAVFENMYENKLKNTVAWSCLGNHDGYTANSDAQTGPYYDIFSFPTNGESGGTPSGTEAYYSFDYGNIHFISLESYETDRSVGGAMHRWLENDLQNTLQEWIVAFWHHPPYTKGSHDSDRERELIEMRQNFLPLLEEYGVDLVLSGHSHSYERSYFLNGHYDNSNTFNRAIHTIGETGFGDGKPDGNGSYQKTKNGPDGKKGAVYITAGSSGKKSGGSLDHSAMYYSVSELGSCFLEVEGSTLQLKFIRETGAIDDYFTIEKSSVNCLVGSPCDDRDNTTDNDIYDVNCNCTGTTVAANACIKIASSNDDAEEQVFDGQMNMSSSDLEMTEENATQLVGIRFQNLPINKETAIANAYIQFTTDERSTGNVNLTIHGEASENATPFTNTDYNLSARPTTDTTINWSPNNWWSEGETGASQRTPDVTPILNEIIQSPSYEKDGAIAFIISGDGKRVAESYDGSPSQAASLCIDYSYQLCDDLGQPCDDGDPCTINDTYDNFCDCIGTFQDTDFDQVCDANDQCAGLEPGMPCSDGDPCTINDIINNNCQCVGTFQDQDNDTTCDGLDLCPNLNDSLIGTACNDGDPCTEDDRYTTNCDCVGTYKDSDNDGTCDAFDQCFGPEPGTTCNDGDVCTINDKIDNNCNCVGEFQDADLDGTCDAEDSCPSFNNNLIGTACNDGNACTINDVYTSNCQCTGVYVDSDNDGTCNAFDKCVGPEPGTACDDNDPCTINDVITANCDCQGTIQDTDFDSVCDANDSCPNLNNNLIGQPCDDNNRCTVGETYTENCECTGGQFTCITKVYALVALEGFFKTNATSMTSELKEKNLLPFSQPFNKTPWNYTGDENTSTFPAFVVDWILIMARDANGNILSQKAGFINSFGQLVATDGTVGIPLEGIEGNYLSIHHPSHLAILSANPYTGQEMDFTTDISFAQGTNQMKLINGKYSLISGDYDNSGIINSLDFNLWKTNGATLNQYMPMDGDGNGIINSLDFNLWARNRSKVGYPTLRN